MTCPHPDTWFSRTLCAYGWMHNHCTECGVTLDAVDACTPKAEAESLLAMAREQGDNDEADRWADFLDRWVGWCSPHMVLP